MHSTFVFYQSCAKTQSSSGPLSPAGMGPRKSHPRSWTGSCNPLHNHPIHAENIHLVYSKNTRHAPSILIASWSRWTWPACIPTSHSKMPWRPSPRYSRMVRCHTSPHKYSAHSPQFCTEKCVQRHWKTLPKTPQDLHGHQAGPYSRHHLPGMH